MSKQEVVFTPVAQSISDGAYQQARLHGTTKSLVKSLMDMIPGLGFSDDAITDDVKAELRKGYYLRWAEENPARFFVAADGNWVEKTEADMNKHKGEKFILDVHTAFAYTQQAFGALKTEDPVKHSLIKETRDKVNKYVSNRVGDLKRDARKIYNEENGIARERSATPLFMQWVMNPDKGALVTMRQRCVNAKAKGDETADLAKLDKALAAFKAVMLK